MASREETASDGAGRRVLVLLASPRRDGNSALLGRAVADGARDAGHAVDVVHVDDHVQGFVRDCRLCRDAAGECTIGDGYRELLLERYLPADGIVFATPIYWYGISAQLKALLDRMFCYIARSYPRAEEVAQGLSGKSLGLVLSSEETYPGASLGILAEMQEFTRYTRSAWVGVVRGIGNRRGDVHSDPALPLEQARALGAELLRRPYSDYRIDSDRPGSTWS